MTKWRTREVRPIPAERSRRTHATSSKPDQNEQNSKLTDGAYFLFDGYGNARYDAARRSVYVSEQIEQQGLGADTCAVEANSDSIIAARK